MSLEPNPKKLFGDKKPPLHLLPLAGMIHQSLAHLDGDNKYGFENWNDKPVEKLTYIGAALRHLELYKYGELYSRDTNVHNLGAVMACCAILLDAELNGNMIDNTKHSKATCDLLHQMEETVKGLNAMQRERDAAKKATEESKLGDTLKQWRADKFTELHSDAMARMQGKNLDGSARRETTTFPVSFLYNDAGGDAPAMEPEPEPTPPVDVEIEGGPTWRTCRDCKAWSACARMGQCIGAEAARY
ncbi:dATP/dGTP diphosphohydrolase domain-containing protein [Bradyrhizobium canariense]|uniref:dATP/dGTP diphosphohydrolase domain-containing protein n=1 Tax=Bradyrhizobium canariense TaxID=255045 RepID=UPI000A194EAF|nr:dATP/dGTP diphosphohydrolase domain-containing protein [Bradyrhizobium canariense]OSI20079.1 hypothetical protein BST65_35215 [Bradyrhizobium canariense]OSI26152.1 hypothetical protein BST66_37980 [Bradyrhizobium canariense]OSI37665.1 hypothetical protein BSZ20_38010 [Bradyrhizobium canariense]OSI42413.1 hypothetical protein BST67_37360 [Bradyrhizobium canariense]OSI57282.1 hypothetical protein BSZ15_14445 [Bradyrhizobium canariense]